MQIKSLLDQLTKTDTFKSFKQEHPDAYFAMGLFILEPQTNDNSYQIDFFLPKKEKLASFEHPTFELTIYDDPIKDLKPQAVDLQIDLHNLKETIQEILTKNETGFTSTKIIAVLKEDEWNITCMDDMLGIVRMKINAKTKEYHSFSKGSILEIAQARGGDLGKKYDQAKATFSSKQA